MAAVALIDDEAPPEHGGDLAAAVRRYGIALSDWLDLSTAVNPNPYPVPSIPSQAFQHLPGDDGALRTAAAACYSPVAPLPADAVVTAPGSQALIQLLPTLRARCRVAVPAVGYREHGYRWRRAGHEVIEYDAAQRGSIDTLLESGAVDVLVVINPNNPLAVRTPRSQLLAWLSQLQQRNGWLVVDEAFADAEPADSVADNALQPGLVVLRSLGKFFGLAGLRCGFALCEPVLAQQLRIALGPWPLSGPALYVAEKALRDGVWQAEARGCLDSDSRACAQLICHYLRPDHEHILRTALFVSVMLPIQKAERIMGGLARRGILVRHLAVAGAEALLRFGLVQPESEAWRRLESGLSGCLE